MTEAEIKARAQELKAEFPAEAFAYLSAEDVVRMTADPDGFGKFMNNIIGPELRKHVKKGKK